MITPAEMAQRGLGQIEDAILELLRIHPTGLTNAEIARLLGVETGQPGQHRNMLSWTIIGRLIEAGRVQREKLGGRSVVILLE